MLLAERQILLPKDWYENSGVKSERTKLVTFYIKICHYFKLSQETLFLSVRLFDLVCSKERVTQSNMIVFYIASIHLCCKLEESKYYKIDSFTDMFGSPVSRSQVILAEERILKLTDFVISAQTPYDFLRRLAQLFGISFQEYFIFL